MEEHQASTSVLARRKLWLFSTAKNMALCSALLHVAGNWAAGTARKVTQCLSHHFKGVKMYFSGYNGDLTGLWSSKAMTLPPADCGI